MSGCCGIDTRGGRPAGGSSGAFAAIAAEYELDFRTLSGTPIVRGAQTIDTDIDAWAGPDPLPANSTMTFGATGLVMTTDPIAAATNFTESQDSAMWFGLRWGSLYDRLGVDLSSLLRVEIFSPSYVLPTGSYLLVCTRGFQSSPGAGNPSGPIAGDERIAGARLFFTGGEECFNSVASVNGGNRFDAGQPGPNVLGIVGSNNNWSATGGFSPAVFAGWPRPEWTQQCANSGQDGPLLDPLSWVIVALASGLNSGAPMSATVERIRVRAFNATPTG